MEPVGWLEPAGTGWNQLEPAGSSWNRLVGWLELVGWIIGTSWNRLIRLELLGMVGPGWKILDPVGTVWNRLETVGSDWMDGCDRLELVGTG